MRRRELFRRVATMAGAAVAAPALSTQDAQAEAIAPASERPPAIELTCKGEHARSATLKLHGLDISNMTRNVVINAHVDNVVEVHVNMLAHKDLDVVLPEANVQVNVTVMPGWSLLVTEDEHGVKRFTTERAS